MRHLALSLIIVALSGLASSLHGQTITATDRFGGTMAIERVATGHFRVEQVNGRWLFITPEGHGYCALGANHIGKFMSDQAGELLNRYGGDRAKAEQSLLQAIHDLGLNAGEAYAPFWPALQTEMPWVANIGYPQGALNYQFDVFDPQWQAKLHNHVVRECRAVANDQWLIGVAFVDQPEWSPKRVDYFRSLPDGSPGKKRLEFHQAAGGSDHDFLGLVADEHYNQLRAAMQEGAPNKLFFGERFVLRKTPDAVLKAVGKHVDVFCTQALILSRHRPPEWQVFQRDGWDHEVQLTGKPILVIDWAAPFSLGPAFDSEHGRIKTEAEAAEDSAKWLTDALAHPGIVGVFRCQLAGTHGNDRWFFGKAKRTYLHDDGSQFLIIGEKMRQANRAALTAVYAQATSAALTSPKGTAWTLGHRNGRQCLLTPDGMPFLILGLSHVSVGLTQNEDSKPQLDRIEQQLRGWGFNTVPAPELWDRFPFVVPLDRLVGDQQSRFEDVFDPAFKARLRQKIRSACAKAKNHPNCIGYWWTDIPPYQTWSKQRLGKSWVDFIRDLPASARGRQRYDAYLNAAGPHEDLDFLRLIVAELYAESSRLFKEFDPDRLIFGERFDTLGVPDAVLEEAAKFVDVISIQPYDKVFKTERFDAIHRLTGKPIVISDWNLSFPTADHKVTMWPQFPTPGEAAIAYEEFLRAAFSRPYILGYFKCQYVDAVLPTGMLKQGLLTSKDGAVRYDFADLLKNIHHRLSEQFRKEGRWDVTP